MTGKTVKNISFSVGQTLTLVSNPNTSERFAVNIGPNEDDIALHINPRFNENVVVYNSCEGGSWGEEIREGNPLSLGQEFKIVVEFTPDGFVVTLSEDTKFQFPNRLGAETYSYLTFSEDVSMQIIDVQ
ncbi:beta-galactoside-binding lectin-like [Parambassis ranga]|uniref:Galectin n=1 Tax=Parambassis ranga TaxID=210632 RepID=A0A6P7IQ18_9TELE|nr:beta-galactoside-binding lectin-like [Parambassis ranga]